MSRKARADSENQVGHLPNPYGLLDLQDVALFLWPSYRYHNGFNLEDQCLILKHRNSRLREISEEDLVEILAWMTESKTITVEDESVDIRKWRLRLGEEELSTRVKRMDEDLKRATSMMRIENEEEDD